MDRPLDPKLIAILAQDVVEQVAPEEHFQFASISAAYKRKPRLILKKQRMRDALSFASAQSVKPLLTPRIFLILHQAFVLMHVDNTKKDRFFLRCLSESIFNTSRVENDNPDLPDFSSEELEHIHEFIVEAALANEFTALEAQQFAEIIVKRLDITQTLRG